MAPTPQTLVRLSLQGFLADGGAGLPVTVCVDRGCDALELWANQMQGSRAKEPVL